MKHIDLKKIVAGLFFLVIAFSSPAQTYILSESFNGDSSYPPGDPDWVPVNNSAPVGFLDWFLGNPATFNAFNGADSSYIASNYNATDSVGTISNWLLTPELELANGNVFRFYTRSPNHQFADRMQVYVSKAGSGTDVGNSATSVGTFSTLLLDINPNLTTAGYPIVWTAYTATVSGITGTGVSGRFGFRYYVTNAGANGANSDYIGIDSVTYYAPAVATGITKVQKNAEYVSLFPNPFKNELIVKGTNGTAQIYDILGKEVLTVEFENGKAIATGSLDRGIYIIRIMNDKGELLRMQKITKE